MDIGFLTLRNFWLSEDLSISFDNRVSVIIDVNGAGVSAVQDAMSIHLRCYVGGFDGVGLRKITQSDIRHVYSTRNGLYDQDANTILRAAMEVAERPRAVY